MYALIDDLNFLQQLNFSKIFHMVCNADVLGFIIMYYYLLMIIFFFFTFTEEHDRNFLRMFNGSTSTDEESSDEINRVVMKGKRG